MKYGIVVPYFSTYYKFVPDFFQLSKEIGASYISGSANRAHANTALTHGMKMMFSYTAPSWDLNSLPSYFRSPELLKAHLDNYNIEQYRGHKGVYSHGIGNEPLVKNDVDVFNLTSEQRSLINTLLEGVKYIKQLDPTHPATVQGIANVGAHDEHSNYLDRRREWIRQFIDGVDYLDYHYYRVINWKYGFFEDLGDHQIKLRTMLKMLVEESRGKPIVIGEFGCPSTPMKIWDGETIVQFSEEIQDTYYRIWSEELKRLNADITVFSYYLADSTYEKETDWGIYETSRDNRRNRPKLVAANMAKYFSDTTPPPPPEPEPEPPEPPPEPPPQNYNTLAILIFGAALAALEDKKKRVWD